MAPEAKIYLADERGITETSWFRSCNTFNFGRYQHKHKTAAGNIYVLNDDTLAGSKSLAMTIEEPTHVLLLPVVGSVSYKDSNDNITTTAAGQLQYSLLGKRTAYTVTNPFKKELVNFLQVWIKAGNPAAAGCSQFIFDIDKNKNTLVKTGPGSPAVYIGKFDGRQETVLPLQNKPAFVFVIQGAFEVQGVLLHSRDGLALQNHPSIELEALSNEAIIFIIQG
ncbi:MAG: hypothetical protein QM791_06415 [Ferruginibacter sp.]